MSWFNPLADAAFGTSNPADSSGRPASPTRFFNWLTSSEEKRQQQEQQEQQDQQQQREEEEIRAREAAIKNEIKKEKEAQAKKEKEAQAKKVEQAAQAAQEERRLRETILAEEERVLQERKAERERARALKKIENAKLAPQQVIWKTERLAVQRTDGVVLNDIKTKVFQTLGIESDTTPEGKITNRLPKDNSLVDVIDLALETYIRDNSSLTVLTKMPDPLYSSSVPQLATIIRLKALSFILNSTNDEPEEYNGYNQLNLRSPTVQITTGGAVGTVGTLVHNQIFCRPQNTPIQPNDDARYALFPTFVLGTHKLVYSIGPIVRDQTSQIIGRTLIMVRVYNYKPKRYPHGIYFWVYPSNSEGGINRQFLKLVDPEEGTFFKGPDYLVTSLIIDLLQVHINMAANKNYPPNQTEEITLETLLRLCETMPCIHLRGNGIRCYTFTDDDADNINGLQTALTQGLAVNVTDHAGKQQTKMTIPLMMCFTGTGFTGARFDFLNDADAFIKENSGNFKYVDFFFKNWDKTTLVQGDHVHPGTPSLAACVLSGAPSVAITMKYNPYLQVIMGNLLSKNVENSMIVSPVATFNDYNMSDIKRDLGEFSIAPKLFSTTGRDRAIPPPPLPHLPRRHRPPPPPHRRLVTFSVRTDPNKRFDALPVAIQTMCANMFHRIYSPEATARGVDDKLKFCFDSFLQVKGITFDEMSFKSFIVSEFNGVSKGSSDTLVRGDTRLHRLMKMVEWGEYRCTLMNDIFKDFIDSEGGVYSNSIDIECSVLMSNGNYSESVKLRMNSDNCDFSDFVAEANPYIFVSRRQSDTFSDTQLIEFTLDSVFHPTFGFSIPRPEVKNITVETKTFFIRLIFYDTIKPSRNTEYGGIQMIVSVSSTMVMAKDRATILSGVDFQFGIIFIGPIRVKYPIDGTAPDLFADATVLATMVDYLSLGCSATTKKAEYTITSRSKQFIAPIEDHFKVMITEDRDYVLTFISPTSSKHDVIMRLFTRAFEDESIISKITSKWGWNPATLAALTAFRQKMAEVVGILVSPMLEQSYTVHMQEDASDISPRVQKRLADKIYRKESKYEKMSRERRTLTAKRRLVGEVLSGEAPPGEALPGEAPPGEAPPDEAPSDEESLEIRDGGRKTVKQVKKYRYNTSKSKPNKSRPNKSKTKPKTKAKTKSKSKPNPKSKCKRRMNMNTATRRR